VNELIQALSQTRLLADVSLESLQAMAYRFEPLELSGGETLMRQGDAGNDLYLLLHGRLRAYVQRDDGSEFAVGEIGPGESVGELAILLEGPRSASVRAVRDSSLVRLSREAVDELLQSDPKMIMGLVKDIVRRARQSQSGAPNLKSVSTVALVAAGCRGAPKEFCQGLLSALSIHGSVACVSAAERSNLGDVSRRDLTRWLHALEAEHDFVIFLADEGPTDWTRLCLRQADRILLVASVGESVELNAVEESLLSGSQGESLAQQELILMQPTEGRFMGTAAWLAQRKVGAHHHIRRGNTADFERIARILTGKAVALVLSGGGARGLAHIGVVKAMAELGIPIDAIGGVSMGSIMAAQVAGGWPWQQMLKASRALFIEHRPMSDKTLPLVSLVRGKRIEAALHAGFGERLIEDMPLPFFCCSSNLSKARLKVHDSGRIDQAIRASLAIPGVLPPVPFEGDLLVDGGVLNNAPVNIMTARFDGAVILSDVGQDTPPGVDPGATFLPGGWSLLWHRLWPFGKAPNAPGIVDILYRTAVLGSTETAARMRELASLCVRPPVANFKTLEFEPVAEIVERGYEGSLGQLSTWWAEHQK
jgi:NTE family protein